MSNNAKVRTIILAAGVTAITVTGAWYGAGLKIKQEFKQVRNILQPKSIQFLRILLPPAGVRIFY